MRKLLLLSIFLWGGICLAQVEQKGRALLYNEEKPKTPLAGVSISAYGATTTLSDQDGSFVLKFRTLHEGDKVNIRRLEKSGYEVFNTDALEQWYITRPNHVYSVILCETATLNRIKDKYRTSATRAYEERLQKAEAEEEKNRKTGLISEEEYQQRIERLEEEHERQMDKIENYVNRIARIDLSTISQEEKKVITSIEQGKFDEAIAAYDKMQIVEKYCKERQNIKKLEEAKQKIQEVQDKHETSSEELYQAALRQVSLLRFTGGEKNIQKAREIMVSLYQADTTLVRQALDLVNFLIDHHDYDEANRVLLSVLPHCKTWSEKANTQSLLASLQAIWTNYEKAQSILLECLELCQANMHEDEESSLTPLLTIYNTYYTLATNSFNLEQDSLTYVYNTHAYEVAQRIYAIDSTRTSLLAKINFSRGNLLNGLGRYKEALPYLEKCLEIYATITEGTVDGTVRARCKSIMANTLMVLGEKEKAIQFTQASIEDVEELYKRNPSSHCYDLGLARFQAALLYAQYRDKAKFLENIDGSIVIYEQMAKKNPQAFRSMVDYIKEFRQETLQSLDHPESASDKPQQ